MKPGPATSTPAMSGLSAIRAAMMSATSRGGLPASFAIRSATLVAQSPWLGIPRPLGSRVGNLGELKLILGDGALERLGDEIGDEGLHVAAAPPQVGAGTTPRSGW